MDHEPRVNDALMCFLNLSGHIQYVFLAVFGREMGEATTSFSSRSAHESILQYSGRSKGDN